MKVILNYRFSVLAGVEAEIPYEIIQTEDYQKCENDIVKIAMRPELYAEAYRKSGITMNGENVASYLDLLVCDEDGRQMDIFYDLDEGFGFKEV